MQNLQKNQIETLKTKIEMLRKQLDDNLKSRTDIPKNQKLSEELDELIVEYQMLTANQ